ncbi:MAG: cupin domain-containing protein [Kurthia sp.]
MYVLRGEVIITLEGEVHYLKEGQTLFYDASKGHYWRNDSTEKCELLVISNA